jgi:hypothetical protein
VTKKQNDYEERNMEIGDSDTDKYPHRTGHNAGHNQLHGTWTVLLVTKRAGGEISFGSSCRATVAV